jgi:hypothetical protein
MANWYQLILQAPEESEIGSDQETMVTLDRTMAANHLPAAFVAHAGQPKQRGDGNWDVLVWDGMKLTLVKDFFLYTCGFQIVDEIGHE